MPTTTSFRASLVAESVAGSGPHFLVVLCILLCCMTMQYTHSTEFGPLLFPISYGHGDRTCSADRTQ